MTFARSKFRAHVKAHKTVIADERWFRKGKSPLGRAFTVAKSVQRHATLIDIRAAQGSERPALATTNAPMPTTGSGRN